MKKLFTRYLCIALIAVLVLAVFTACGNSEGNDKKLDEATTGIDEKNSSPDTDDTVDTTKGDNTTNTDKQADAQVPEDKNTTAPTGTTAPTPTGTTAPATTATPNTTVPSIPPSPPNPGNSGNGNSGKPTTPTYENPDIAGKDYQGYEFTFITEENNNTKTRYIVAEIDTGEILGDAITKRNSVIEQKYNIVIKQKKVDDVLTRVRSSIMSGTIEFDAILASSTDLASMAVEGLLYDLNTVDRFDFNQAYWDYNAGEQLAFGNKLYFTNCDLNIHGLGYAMFFNKYLINEYNLKSPYEYMANNTWTIDNWAKMVKSVQKDITGDGQMTSADRFGLVEDHTLPRMFAYASGIRATTNNANGKPVVTLLDDKTKLETIYAKLHELLSDSEHVCCTQCDYGSAYGFPTKNAYAKHLFSLDYYLFIAHDAADVEYYKDMTNRFGIVPFPKSDASQTSYQTMYPVEKNLFALPALIYDEDRTFNIIEDMNYYSSKLVYPTWFDVILVRRHLEDDAENNLKMLKENRVYDLGMYYDFGELRTKVMDENYAKTYNITRNYEKYKKYIQNEIDALYYMFVENTRY